MRPRPISRFLALASNVLSPVVLLATLAGTALTARDASAGADVALSASAAQRASQVSGAAPVLSPPSAMTVLVNQTADQTLHATDAQGDPLTFSKGFGPAYMTVTTTDPGTGNATGNIHLAPGSTTEQTQGSVSVSDGILSDQASFDIRVTTPPQPPVLDPVADVTLGAGSSAVRALHATDPNGDELTFYLASGPSYATVSTEDPLIGLGSLRLNPTYAVAGSATVRVGVTDGTASDEKSLTVTVTRVEVGPVMPVIPEQILRGGEIRDVTLTATDANGDPLAFSKVQGPAYLDVTTTDPGHGTAFGRMRFTPAPSLDDTMTAFVSVSDGELSAERFFLVTVHSNHPPVLNQPYSMQLRAGTTASQYLYGQDPDNDAILILSKASGPDYVTIEDYSNYPGYAYGRADVSPLESDAGFDTVWVRVSDRVLFDEKSFTVNVTPPLSGPILAQPADMVATAGEINEQTVTATDADGSYIYMYRVSGPAYMSLQSNSNYGTATAIVSLRPGIGDVGTATGVIAATDFTITDTKSFGITVVLGNFPALCPAGSFTPLNAALGAGVFDIQTADLNGDGVLDLVVEMPDVPRLVTALGNGNGTFGSPTDLDSGFGPITGTIADFNRDETPDLAVANYYSGTISIYTGDGTGAFPTRRTYTVGSGPRGVAAADVNRDGIIDLLVCNTDVGTISLLRGVGDGTFLAATNVASGASASQIALPDLNGDGAPDLVAANTYQNNISTYLNNGAGVFGSKTDYPTGQYPIAITAGDVNGDGKSDVAVANYYSAYVTVLLGNGTGGLGFKRSFPTSYYPYDIALVELNGDGHPDIVTGNSGGGASILLGDGTGGFAPKTDLPGSFYGVTTGDFDDDLRNDLALASYYDGDVRVFLNANCAPDLDHPPVVKAPKKVTGGEGAVLSFTVTASDPDGPAVTSLTASFAGLPLGNNAAFTANGLNSAGTFTWTPTYMDARTTPYPVTITATNVLSGSAMTKITVTNTNRAPLANAGGPYTAFAGVPLILDGRGSADPDGDPLGYAWVFGDGASGTGAQPAHSYAAIGVYGIGLTVTDGSLVSFATTTANIVGLFQARAFTAAGNRNIRLNAGKPQWCVELEAIGNSYLIETVDMRSLVMRSPGTGTVEEIHAILGKSSAGGDKDANGVEEINACFAKTDLRLLFANMHGTGSATVSFEGNLYTGGRFRATMDVGIIAGGGNLAATISPNPLNPSATLTYVTTRPGTATLQFFDPQGRLVRTVFHESRVEPGYHDVPIDGRDDRGASLASGVYYFRLHATEGTTTGRFTVLR